MKGTSVSLGALFNNRRWDLVRIILTKEGKRQCLSFSPSILFTSFIRHLLGGNFGDAIKHAIMFGDADIFNFMCEKKIFQYW